MKGRDKPQRSGTEFRRDENTKEDTRSRMGEDQMDLSAPVAASFRNFNRSYSSINEGNF